MLSPITSADQSDESNEAYAFTPAEYRRLAWYRAAVAAGFYNDNTAERPSATIRGDLHLQAIERP